VSGTDQDLVALARANGVAPSYLDVNDEEQHASPEVLRAVLEHLGVTAGSPDDVRRERWTTTLEPVTVAWEGRGTLVVRGPLDRPPTGVELRFEEGAEQTLPVNGEPAQVEEVDGRKLGEWHVPLAHLPAGVHHAAVGDAQAVVLAAPTMAPPRRGRHLQWGVFAPLYALRDARGGPVGDLSSLAELAGWAHRRGADWVATLPLLPCAYEDDPVDPSPYRPLTRLAWNELYLDPARLPELDDQELLPPPADEDVVAWGHLAGEVHGLLARAVDRLSDRRRAELEVFLAARPDLAAYARWRGGGQDAIELLHAYAQWALHDQLADLSRGLDERGQALYLDLPLGVHPDGYDATVHADAFARGVSVGAPPDSFFGDGQDWGFSPLHPQRTRADGHAYLRACLDHHLGPARMLRLDHVMGLHRLWWIPDGASAADGAYVAYPAEEQYAVLTLAAARHGAEIIGENLGTVPPEVDEALAEHGIAGMWPLQLAVPAGDTAPPAGSLAVVNTHDMAPFAAFWAEGGEPRDAVVEFAGGETDPAAVLDTVLVELGTGPARHVQVSYEDLWLEDRPQNQPGTGAEAGNWTRRAARTIEEVAGDPEVEAIVDDLEAARRTADTLSERSAS
jgi:4-alpha-glucanotransferase